MHLSHLFRDPYVAAAFKAAEDGAPAPASQPRPTQPRQSPIRALTIFDSLPRNHRTLLISDAASAPHLTAGEYAVIDTTDRELQVGELYLIQYSSGRHVVQLRSLRADGGLATWPATARPMRSSLAFRFSPG